MEGYVCLSCPARDTQVVACGTRWLLASPKRHLPRMRCSQGLGTSTRRCPSSATQCPLGISRPWGARSVAGITCRQVVMAAKSREEVAAYQDFERALGGSPPAPKPVGNSTAGGKAKQTSQTVPDRGSVGNGKARHEEEQQFEDMKRHLARSGAGFFTQPTRLPRSLLKAKARYTTPEMEAERAATLRELAEAARQPPAPPQPKPSLAVQRPVHPGGVSQQLRASSAETLNPNPASVPRGPPPPLVRPPRLSMDAASADPDLLELSGTQNGAAGVGSSTPQDVPPSLVTPPRHYMREAAEASTQAAQAPPPPPPPSLVARPSRPSPMPAPETHSSDPLSSEGVPDESPSSVLEREASAEEHAKSLVSDVSLSEGAAQARPPPPPPSLTARPSRPSPALAHEADPHDSLGDGRVPGESSSLASASEADAVEAVSHTPNVSSPEGAIPGNLDQVPGIDIPVLGARPPRPPKQQEEPQAAALADREERRAAGRQRKLEESRRLAPNRPISLLPSSQPEDPPAVAPDATSQPGRLDESAAELQSSTQSGSQPGKAAESSSQIPSPAVDTVEPGGALSQPLSQPAVKAAAPLPQAIRPVRPPASEEAAEEADGKSTADDVSRVLGEAAAPVVREMLPAEVARGMRIAREVSRKGVAVPGTILYANYGGLVVQCDGFQGFMPMRMLSPEKLAAVQAAINTHSKSMHTGNNVMSPELRGEIQRRALTSFVGDATAVHVVSVHNPFQQGDRKGYSRSFQTTILSEQGSLGSSLAKAASGSKPPPRTNIQPVKKAYYPKDVRDIMIDSIGEVVEATVTRHSEYGAFLEFDVAPRDNDVFPVVGLVDPKEYWPPGEAPKVNSNITAIIKDVKPVSFHVYLSMRRPKRPLTAAKPDAESLDSLLQNPRDNDMQAQEGNLKETEQVCAQLRSKGVTATPGRRLRGQAFAPELQVYLAKQRSDAPDSSKAKDGSRKYVLVVRLGNELQEINVQSSCDREAMKVLIAETVSRGSSPSMTARTRVF